MTPAKRSKWAGLVAVLALAALVHGSGLGEGADLALLDMEFAALRTYFPRGAGPEVVIVGIDEESTRRFPEPIALWHPHLGACLRALAAARPAAVGVDVVPPERSYDFLLPGHDRALLEGVLALRRAAPLVFAVTVDAGGHPRPVYPPLLSAAGPDSAGFALWRADPDGTTRRFDERLEDGGAPVPTFAGVLARRLGAQPGVGLVDFSRGGAFGYVPFHQVLDWLDASDGAALERAFAGRLVLVGSVLPFTDRQSLPVGLAAWEPGGGRFVPGVLLNAQALRSLLGEGLVRTVPATIVFLLALLASGLWFLPLGPGPAALGAGALSLSAWAASAWLLHRGVFLPVATPLATGLVALLGRSAFDTALAALERQRLRRAFSGYVSPQIMDEILEGRLAGGLGGAGFRLCVLFADIRDFTTRSEGMAPEALIALLNRYFEGVTQAIHAHGGTVDKFLGDGIMAFFGAPKPLDNPAPAAFAAAGAMLRAVEELNAALRAEGAEPLRIGIGLHQGDAVVGHVGAAARHEYTAIGDVVNVASRLEGLTKEVGFPLVCSRAVAQALDPAEGLVYVGARPVKGHTPVEVFGWSGQSLGARDSSSQKPLTAEVAEENPRTAKE